MNNLRKNAAVKKYAPFKAQGLNDEQLKAVISQDERNYPAEEIDEIVAALDNGESGEDLDSQDPAKGASETAATTTGATVNEMYEEFNVDLQYKTIKNEWTGEEKRVLKDGEEAFLKVGKPIRQTSINPETAELLNTQSQHSRRRYYLKGK